MPPTPPEPTQPEPTPPVLLVAAAAPLLLAAGLVALAVAVVVAALRGDRSSVLDAALLVGLLLAWAAGLGLAARGLVRCRRWARAPVLLSELLLAAVGVPLAQGSAAQWAGYLVVAVSVIGAVVVLSPPVTAVLQD